jgi:hypothetical protein
LNSASGAFIFTELRGNEVSFTVKVLVMFGLQAFERKWKNYLHG